MYPQQVEMIKQQLRWRETDDLIEIWQDHNREEWTEEAFEAIRQILLSRGENLPPYQDREKADEHLEVVQAYITTGSFRGADAVTLFVGFPLLAVSFRLVERGGLLTSVLAYFPKNHAEKPRLAQWQMRTPKLWPRGKKGMNLFVFPGDNGMKT